jgi:hypothetical protein
MAQLVLGGGATIGVAAAGTAINPIAGAAIVVGASILGAVIDNYWLYPMLRSDKKDKRPDINDSPFDNGMPCPHAIGRVRVPGQVIWASDPIFTKSDDGKTKAQAGTTDKETITRHLAVAFHRGPIETELNPFTSLEEPLIEKVFANGTLVFHRNGLPTTTTLTTHTFFDVDSVEVGDPGESTYQRITITLTYASEALAISAYDVLKEEGYIKFNAAGASNIEEVSYEGGFVPKIAVSRSTTTIFLFVQAKKTIYEDSGPVTYPLITLADFTTGGTATITMNGNKEKRFIAGYTLYSGDFEQPIDPLIASYFPLIGGNNQTPAYRGTAYVVFESFDSTSWGGTIPTFEIVFSTTATLPVQSKTAFINILKYGAHSDLVKALRYYAVDSNGDSESFDGIFWQGPISAMQKISDLALLSKFNVFEGFDVLDDGVFIPTIEVTNSTRPSIDYFNRTIVASDATCREFGEQGPIEPTITKTPLDEIPNSLNATFLNSANDHLQETITHQLVSADTNFVTRNDLSIKLPFALYSTDAQKYAIRMFWDTQLQKDFIEFHLPPSYYDLYAGDSIDYTAHNMTVRACIVEIEAGSNGMLIAKAVINDGLTGEQHEEDDGIPDPDVEVAAPALILVETAPLQDADIGKCVVYAAITYTGAFPSEGFQIYYAVAGNPLFYAVGKIRYSTYSSYTTSTTALLKGPLIDYQFISINNQAEMPVGSSAELVDATDGSARYYVGGELMGVGNEADPNITQLARGMESTPTSSKASEVIVAYMPEDLRGWLRIELPLSHVGKVLEFQAVTGGSNPLDVPVKSSRLISGKSLYNPVPYGISSYRRNAVSVQVYCYARGPRSTDVLGSGHINSGEVLTYRPYIDIITSLSDPHVVRTLFGSHLGGGQWIFSYLSADQRTDYDSGGSDPTNIYMRFKTTGVQTTTLFYAHLGTDNYMEQV